MEEEINYSTLVFKNSHSPPAGKKEESPIYSEIKTKRPATTAPISLVMNQQKANLSSLSAENQQLIMQRSILENETEELRRDKDSLNWTLGVILKYKTFPVNDYCPEKKCQPCQTGWILFQKKCYLFYDKDPPWKSWESSKEYCQNKAAHLVVIDTLQEQVFINKHIKSYFSIYHGYWIGLHADDDKNWFWVDGRNDTLQYWMMEKLGDSGQCALMIPGRDVTASWDPANCLFWNKLICETEALMRFN
ncbi:hypothetical protein PAMP_002725 [Pampus punctatissimus]